MSQDAAGRVYLHALSVFLAAGALTVGAYRWRDRVPGARVVLVIGGTLVVGGAAFLLYLAVLTLRGTSARRNAEWEEYLAGLKADEREGQSTERQHTPGTAPESPPRGGK